MSSRESLYDTVFEWNLEHQLDVLHAWDTTEEWSDWLSGEPTNQQFLEAELQPLRDHVDIRKTVKQWEKRTKGSAPSLVEVADANQSENRGPPPSQSEERESTAKVKDIVKSWGQRI